MSPILPGAAALWRRCNVEERGAPAARRELAAMGPADYGYLRCLAICGDAQGTLDALASDRSFGVFLPIHAEWRSDAERKLHRGR